VRPGAHRLVQQRLNSRLAELPDLPVATVTAITVGGGTDGLDLVTVNWNGSPLDLPHLNTYTPVVGDRVVLLRVGGLPTIIGRPVGFPTSD
jgi:hypothetical protein